MKAIILAGGQDTHLMPLVRAVPKPLLPVANRPMIEYLLRQLRASGIRDVALAVNANSDSYQQILGNGRKMGLRLSYSQESMPRGTAGCLLPLADFIGDETFLVMHGSLFLDTDLKELCRHHREQGGAATVAVRRHGEKSRDWHHLELQLGAGSQIQGIKIRNLAEGEHLIPVPAGLYVFEPSVLSTIDEGLYFDIKEQLLPRLRDKGNPIFAWEIPGFCENILELEDYLRINRAVLRGDVNGYRFDGQIAEGIWVGGGCRVSETATLIGPVMVGRDCVISSNSQIIGPTSIGDGCVVGESAMVRESYLLPGVRIESGARVEGCVLAADTVVRAGQTLREVVAVPDSLDLGDIDLADPRLLIRGMSAHGGRYPRQHSRYFVSAFIKRTMDLVGAIVGLVGNSWLILLVALAIKFSSPGPIFFRQKRCGRNGREFTMVKFRTMVEDAEGLQAGLQSSSEVDGPVFKIENDPRSTPLGKWLRKFSLDELPQFWNVLKGEMSMVGPRPLAGREMRFCPAWRDTRLKVRPGVTGLWQVSGRSKTSFQDWIRLDIDYVRNRSTLLDLKILAKTIMVVVRGIGSF